MAYGIVCCRIDGLRATPISKLIATELYRVDDFYEVQPLKLLRHPQGQ